MTTVITKRRPIILAVLLVLIAGIALISLGVAASGPSTADRMQTTGLAYASNQMVFQQGPTVVSVHLLPLHALSATLRTAVPPAVDRDVNVGGLLQQYGAQRRVALVVLTGYFNTLPPDEGVMIHGKVLVLVDVKHNKAFYIMD